MISWSMKSEVQDVWQYSLENNWILVVQHHKYWEHNWTADLSHSSKPKKAYVRDRITVTAEGNSRKEVFRELRKQLNISKKLKIRD